MVSKVYISPVTTIWNIYFELWSDLGFVLFTFVIFWKLLYLGKPNLFVFYPRSHNVLSRLSFHRDHASSASIDTMFRLNHSFEVIWWPEKLNEEFRTFFTHLVIHLFTYERHANESKPANRQKCALDLLSIWKNSYSATTTAINFNYLAPSACCLP